MNRFAELLDRLAYEPRRNAKLALLVAYFRTTPDPERGFALAALTGALRFGQAKPAVIRDLIATRVDPVLFALSYDYVGDLSETVALLWDETPVEGEPINLTAVVTTLDAIPKKDLPEQLARSLDALDAKGRWALLKLITGGLRIGVSARLAKTAVAALGTLDPNDVEQVWHGVEAPYETLFAWAEGRGPKPHADSQHVFRPVMLAHPLEEADMTRYAPEDFLAEWKWDGIRIQAACFRNAEGRHVTHLYSRTGEDISPAFPDLMEAVPFEGVLDGELLILREERVQSFNVLQQRLNRKQVTGKLIAEFPAHIRVYDLLVDGQTDLRPAPFAMRRARLEALLAQHITPQISLSSLIPFTSWEGLTEARANPEAYGAGEDAHAVEGCMIKRADSSYVPGRPKGLWFKWKRDPMLVDAVLMYAQRGHGKRSSYFSDFTFGCWRAGPDGDELVPVGKAYFGFTDEELLALDRYVRKNATERFGPVRGVAASKQQGLVLEIAFEGIQRSPRHRSGVAMRFPRIHRIRWDKPAAEADRLETLEKLIADQP